MLTDLKFEVLWILGSQAMKDFAQALWHSNKSDKSKNKISNTRLNTRAATSSH